MSTTITHIALDAIQESIDSDRSVTIRAESAEEAQAILDELLTSGDDLDVDCAEQPGLIEVWAGGSGSEDTEWRVLIEYGRECDAS